MIFSKKRHSEYSFSDFFFKKEERDYSPFFAALKGNVTQWWHFIEQTCVVVTEHNIQTLTALLLPYFESTDSLLIVQVAPHEMQGWLPPRAWEWLNGVSEAIAPRKPVLPPLPRLRG